MTEIESTLVTTRFLGCSVRVAPLLATVLARVETVLHDEWTRAQLALPGGAPVQAFAAWHGVRGVGGYRPHGGWHAKGIAVDLNYSTNGYAVCRSTVGAHVVHGGEAAGAGLAGVRRAFADACDRACLACAVESFDSLST